MEVAQLTGINLPPTTQVAIGLETVGVESTIGMIDDFEDTHRFVSGVHQGNGEQGVGAIAAARVDTPIHFVVWV